MAVTPVQWVPVVPRVQVTVVALVTTATVPPVAMVAPVGRA